MNTTYLDYLEAAPAEAIALVDDKEQCTYGELRQAARQMATVLQAQYGTRQYLMLRATSEARFVLTLLGIMYSGNTPIPVDQASPEAILQFMQQKSRAVAVLDPLWPSDYAHAIPTRHTEAAVPALIMFTSGTTGFPKGVIISQANLIHSCTAISTYLTYHQHRSAAVVLPLHYSYALLSQVCCQLFVGGRVRLLANFRNPIKFSRVVNTEALTTFCGVPSTYHALVVVHRLSPLCMPAVRVLCSAGAAMDRSKFREIKEIFPNATFFNNYGMTEAAPRIAYIREDDPRFFEPTCGRPMAGVDVKIVAPDTHKELPEGQEGMLVVRGPNVTRGYLHDEEITRQAFTRDGYLISGDIAYMEQGYLFIRGRHDDIFNVGGEKVAPLEVERVLHECPAVETAAVVGLPDTARGMVPVAFLKLRQPVVLKELLQHLHQALPQIKVPQRFFEVRDFPMTANGKLQRRRLAPDDSAYVIREIH
jgi:acyl-CoA synthetase (AMP-forming)/AMP-acid ligase II